MVGCVSSSIIAQHYCVHATIVRRVGGIRHTPGGYQGRAYVRTMSSVSSTLPMGTRVPTSRALQALTYTLTPCTASAYIVAGAVPHPCEYPPLRLRYRGRAYRRIGSRVCIRHHGYSPWRALSSRISRPYYHHAPHLRPRICPSAALYGYLRHLTPHTGTYGHPPILKGSYWRIKSRVGIDTHTIHRYSWKHASGKVSH